MANIYHPKGSMCGACVNKDMPCDKAMDFKVMPIMSQYSTANDDTVYKIVNCLMFNKTNK